MYTLTHTVPSFEAYAKEHFQRGKNKCQRHKTCLKLFITTIQLTLMQLTCLFVVFYNCVFFQKIYAFTVQEDKCECLHDPVLYTVLLLKHQRTPPLIMYCYKFSFTHSCDCLPILAQYLLEISIFCRSVLQCSSIDNPAVS